MKAKDLAKQFYNYAQDVAKLKEPSAKYRAINYTRAGVFIEELFGDSIVTKTKIEKSDLSDRMKEKAILFLENSFNKNNFDKTDNKTNLIEELIKINGIGRERANILIKEGVKSVSDLKKKKYNDMLNNDTKLFLSIKPEKKIPHEHIKIFEEKLKLPIKYMFVGSYRRKKEFSSDIDIMLISNDENIIDKFLLEMEKKYKVYVYSKGKDKISLYIDFSVFGIKAIYKIDAFRCDVENKIPMLIYATGSREFNIYMRGKAKRMGYLLNQHGLFKEGKKIILKTEKDYFKILDIEYKTPENRK